MAISTNEELLADDDVIELEPTQSFHLHGAGPSSLSASYERGPAVALVEGTLASFTGETEELRRKRLQAAAIFLAAAYGLLFVWVFASDNPATLTVDGSSFSFRVLMIGLRCLLAAGVAGLLSSELQFTRPQLRIVEYALFLGTTLILIASQYFVGLDLMQRGPDYAPMLLAFVKDGVIQLLVLMMMYGTLIPNTPKVAISTLVVMFVGPIIGVLLLELNPDLRPMLAHLAKAEEAGSNILCLGIGMALAIYSSFLLNGLRSELHTARKFGQYELVKKLGEGGMGEVYLAEHQMLKRPCALKLIKPEAGADPIALARFEREVRSAARLSHHNIIAIYDYGHTEDGTFYYVMEYLEGKSLAELVRETGPLPAGRVIYLFRQACAGLAEAHALGLVHRDLKPGNLFIAARGGEFDVVKVLDFGLVKLTKDPSSPTLTSDMTVSGTPLFMAPEQAVGDRSLDTRADIYALGAMMYFAVTGKPPFTGDNPFEVMMAHARDPVVPPSQVHPGVPPEFEQVVLRCLAKKAADRYQDVKALSQALAACPEASDWNLELADHWWADNVR